MSTPTLPSLREGNDPSTKEIFISYAHESATSAHRIASILRNFGMRVWIDVGILQLDSHSTVVSHEIAEAIVRATDFVAVVCANSGHKPWISHETELAAARWLATGRPRIHVALLDASAALPPIPFTSLIKLVEGDEGAVLRTLIAGVKPPQESPTDAEMKATILRLREQFLMGGSTAASALNEFEACWPIIEAYISVKAKTATEQPTARWAVARLGKLIDARISRRWLTDIGHKLSAQFGHDMIDGILTNNIGIAHLYSGNLQDARRWFWKSLKICEELVDVPGTAYAHANLALVELESSNNVEAQARINNCYNCAKALRDDPQDFRVSLELEGLCWSHSGMLSMEAGDFASARGNFYEQFLRMELIDSARGKGVALGSIAISNIFSGQANTIDIRLLQRYLKLSIEYLNPAGAANAMAWLGLASYSMGKHEDAISHLEQGISLQVLNRESIESRRNEAWLKILRRDSGRPDLEMTKFSLDSVARESDRILFSVANGDTTPNPSIPSHAFLWNVIGASRYVPTSNTAA